jgi:hypothetical protein
VSAAEERWNEPESIVLLQRTAKLVAGIEASGVRMPQGNRELCHARLVAAHDARGIAAYRATLEGYENRARNAYRKAKGVRKSVREAEIARIISAPLSVPSVPASFRQ